MSLWFLLLLMAVSVAVGMACSRLHPAVSRRVAGVVALGRIPAAYEPPDASLPFR